MEPAFGPSYQITIPADEPITKWTTTPYPTPRPECTINDEDCIPFMADFISSSEAYRSNNSMPYYTHPPCTTYRACPPEDGDMCKLVAAASTIWYWPVTVEGDFCGERTTITHPEPTRSTVISGTTFVSPSAYISMEYLEAHSHKARYTQTPCGHPTSDFLISLNPTDVSTRWGRRGRNYSSFRRIDFADLNDPVPVTAAHGLEEAPDCVAAPENCTMVLGVGYTPVLAAPVQALRDVDPEFEFCDLHPSWHGTLGAVTWIPLEPTQAWWPEPTAEPEPEGGEEELEGGEQEADEEDEEDEGQEGEEEEEEEGDVDGSSDEPSVTQVISTVRAITALQG